MNHTSAKFSWSLRSNRKKEVKGLSCCLHCECAANQLSFVGDFTGNHSWKGLCCMSVFTGDKPHNTLTHSKCNSDIYNVGPTDQRAASHGNKRPLVLTTKPLSDIRGQRSSFLPFPIPLLSLTLRSSSPQRHFSDTHCCQYCRVSVSLAQRQVVRQTNIGLLFRCLP